MALLWKMICNLGDPMRLGHPVRLLWVMTCANVTIESCLMMACDLTYDVSPYDNQPLRPPLSVFLSCLLSFFLSFFLFYTGGYQNAFRCFSKENLEIFLFCWYLKSMTWCYKWFHSYIVRESRVANTLDGSDFDILPINKKQIHSHGKKNILSGNLVVQIHSMCWTLTSFPRTKKRLIPANNTNTWSGNLVVQIHSMCRTLRSSPQTKQTMHMHHEFFPCFLGYVSHLIITIGQEHSLQWFPSPSSRNAWPRNQFL